MNRSQRIAIWVLTLIGLLAAWKLFGQGFGNFRTDQPFLARNYPTTQPIIPASFTQYLKLWWHGEDAASGSVASWTDRVSGVPLTQGVLSQQPFRLTNYVKFSGPNLLITNLGGTTLATDETYTYIFVVGEQGYFTGYGALLGQYTAESYPGFLAPDPNQANGLGISFRETASTVALLGCVTNNLRFDFAFSWAGAHQDYWSNYYDGVYNTEGGKFYCFDNESAAVGNNSSLTMGLQGRIWDVFVFSNVPSASVALVVSNIHWWQTNYYGVPALTAADALVSEWKASYGVTNTSDALAASGDKVKSWKDAAGANVTMQQLGADNLRPFYVSSGGPNNAAYLSFPVTNSTSAGLTNRMSTAYYLPRTNICMMVVRFGKSTVEGVPWASTSPESASVYTDWSIRDDNRISVNAGAAGPAIESDAGSITTNIWYLVTVSVAGNGTYVRTNGVTLFSGNTGSSAEGNYRCIGNYPDAANASVCDIAHIRTYNLNRYPSWTSNDMRNAESTLGSLYGITIP